MAALGITICGKIIFVMVVVQVRICFGTIDIVQKNVSCSDIRIQTGYKFSHECPAGSEISVFKNETLIANIKPGKTISLPEDHHVKETVVYFKIKEKMKNPDQNPELSLRKLISICSVIPVGITGIIGLSVWCYIIKMRHQQTAATVLGYFRYLLLLCSRKPQAERAEITGSGTDLQPDGNTPYANSLDHNANNEGAQLTKNGDISVPDDNRAMNRNLRDDPGGRDIVTITETRSGCVYSDCGPEDLEAEGELLLWNERANIQGSDMTSQPRCEAIALVKCSFDPEQVSSCFAAPNTDVESVPKMKNSCIQIY